jgi:hypothetical protein
VVVSTPSRLCVNVFTAERRLDLLIVYVHQLPFSLYAYQGISVIFFFGYRLLHVPRLSSCSAFS